jgi:hypothetical protein
LLSLQYEICGDSKEVSGKANVKLKVELFSTKTKKVAYSATLNGSFASDKKIKMEVFDDAVFGSALDTMFADPRYVDIFRDGEPVAQAVGERIDVVNGTAIKDGMQKNAKEVLNLVVTVDGSLGSGSGFSSVMADTSYPTTTW